MGKSKIQWTERTWNPITGCTKVSAGCKNCYAAPLHRRLIAMGSDKYKAGFGTVVCHTDVLNEPLKRKKPTTYFVCSMSDLFHKDVPDLFIHQVFTVMNQCPQHTFQILTKRHERFEQIGNHLYWSPNIIAMVTAENQTMYDLRVPALMSVVPIQTYGVSIEPMLEHIDLLLDLYLKDEAHPEWIIVGCESGPNRRPCNPDWIRGVVSQCKQANIPVFVKQIQDKNGKVIKDIDRFPEDLRVREYPK